MMNSEVMANCFSSTVNGRLKDWALALRASIILLVK